MPVATLRIVIALVLLAHGLGHALSLFPLFGLKLSRTHSLDSWLLSGMMDTGVTHAIGVVLWLATLMVFVAAGLGLLGWLVPHERWQWLAILAAVVSLVALAVYWDSLPFLFPNKVGAIAVDAAVLLSLLWLHWPSQLANT